MFFMRLLFKANLNFRYQIQRAYQNKQDNTKNFHTNLKVNRLRNKEIHTFLDGCSMRMDVLPIFGI